MGIRFNESVWKVSRHFPATGWRAEGEAPPQPRQSGLWFHSDKGENRFLPLDLDKMPSQEQVDNMTLDDFVSLFTRATPR
jgi:hypothetical protein